MGLASITGTSFGPNFDASTVTSGTASVAFPNIYVGLQCTDAGGYILANTTTPSVTIAVTDAGNNVMRSAALGITTTTAATNLRCRCCHL